MMDRWWNGSTSPVVVFPGDRRNLKVTTADDLIMVEALLQRGRD